MCILFHHRLFFCVECLRSGVRNAVEDVDVVIIVDAMRCYLRNNALVDVVPTAMRATIAVAILGVIFAVLLYALAA